MAAAPSFPATIDGITYDIMKPGEEEAVTKLAVEDFCLHEPLSQSLKVPKELTSPIMKILIQRGIADGVSLKAVDATTGELVAARVSFMHEKSRTAEDNALYEHCMKELVPERLKPFVEFYNGCQGEVGHKLYETYDIDKYVEFFFVSVRVDYRGRKIAQRILDFCYNLYKSLGVTLVKVVATNPATAHIFLDKHGFEEIAKFRILDFVHEGKPYFQGIREDAVFVQTLVKRL